VDVGQIASVLGQCEVVELSHVLEEGMPCFPRSTPLFRMPWASYHQGDRTLTYTYLLNEHTASHVDAPAHFCKGKPTIDEIATGKLMGPCLTLDFSRKDPDSELTAEEIRTWESEHERIAAGDVVLLRFGWDRFWHLKPDDKEFAANWPGLGEDGAAYLVEKQVKLVGTDVFAIDNWGNCIGGRKSSPVHYILLGNGVLVAEALASLDKLPVRSYFMCLPLRFRGGSGSPVRAIALVPRAQA